MAPVPTSVYPVIHSVHAVQAVVANVYHVPVLQPAGDVIVVAPASEIPAVPVTAVEAVHQPVVTSVPQINPDIAAEHLESVIVVKVADVAVVVPNTTVAQFATAGNVVLILALASGISVLVLPAFVIQKATLTTVPVALTGAKP